MTAQVIFLNTGHRPSEEEAERLEAVQEALTLFHAEFAFATRGFSPVAVKMRKRDAHATVRRSMELVRER